MAKFRVYEKNNGRPVLASAAFDCPFKAASWGRKAYVAPFMAFEPDCAGERRVRSEMRKACLYGGELLAMESTESFHATEVLPNGNNDFIVGCAI